MQSPGIRGSPRLLDPDRRFVDNGRRGGDMDQDRWILRVIPRPKEISVEGAVALRPGSLRLVLPGGLDAGTRWTVESLFDGIAGDPGTPALTVRFLPSGDAPAALAERLCALPCADQAYAVQPRSSGGGMEAASGAASGTASGAASGTAPEILCAASAAAGFLNAARTLSQLFRRGDGSVEAPLPTIADWPDLPERGEWGGSSAADIGWTSRWKLNHVETHSKPQIDASGRPFVEMDADLIRRGRAQGVKVVPILIHIEQLSKAAGLLGDGRYWSVPDPSRPLPSDYVPGLCMASAAVADLLRDWLSSLARRGDVTDIMVWLSEDRSPCFCASCSGREPYELEVRAILAAFRAVQKVSPEVRLRILTSQGSYPVNDRVLALIPPDVGVTYYDGGRTYDSSRSPMIYPLLADYAKAGRWLGCYPQIVHSWRAVFPWTGPQFLRARAREFVSKGLSSIAGYTALSNRFCEFNVAALAEWTWNAEGRSEAEFCRAYAERTGIAEPGFFARWALKAGEAGWVLAESRLLLTLIYNPSLGFAAAGDDHRFEMAALQAPADTPRAAALAREALVLARSSGLPLLIDESECLLAGLEALTLLGPLRESLARTTQGAATDATARRETAGSLDRLDGAAASLYRHLLDWGHRLMAPSGEKLPTRLLDTACALLRACDALRRRAASCAVEDPRPETRLKALGGWSAAEFASGQETVMAFDIGPEAPGEGTDLLIGFEYLDSAYGTDILSVRGLRRSGGEWKAVTETPDVLKRVSVWERWAEVRLPMPARSPDGAGGGLRLEIGLRGFPPDAPEGRRTSSGRIGLRWAPQ